jgi:hypothetical protein
MLDDKMVLRAQAVSSAQVIDRIAIDFTEIRRF